MDIQKAIAKLADHAHLTEKESEAVLIQIMDGQASPAQIAAFLMGLRMKGETVEEISGAVRAMRNKATTIRTGRGTLIDTCGTGGDGLNTFNISTTAAFVVAAAGLTVAKHGNRSISSRSGSADVLMALGVNIDTSVAKTTECIQEVGIGFLFAPLFHGAMKHCAVPRKEMGIRTILNILGPLSNPAGATLQVVGVYDGALTELLAKVLIHLGAQHCFIVHGMDGLDEITLTTRTQVAEGKAGRVSSYFLDPSDFGLQTVPIRALQGGSADDNALITRKILKGEKGPQRDIVCLNAAAALIAGGKAKGWQDGFQMAGQLIDTGAAMEKLEQLIQYTNSE